MLKLAAVAITASLAAGTTYVVAHTSSSTKPATRSVVHTAAARPTSPFVFATSAPPAPTLVAHAAGSNTVTCADVGMHIAHMALDGEPDLPPASAMRDTVYSSAAQHFEDGCVAGHWTQGYMSCVLGAPDTYSMMLDCAPYMTPEMEQEPLASAIGSGDGSSTFVLMPRTDHVAPVTDTSCASIARHAADMIAPDPASLANVPADHRQAVADGIARASAEMPAQMEKACVDTAWTDARRACIAAATSVDEMSRCE